MSKSIKYDLTGVNFAALRAELDAIGFNLTFSAKCKQDPTKFNLNFTQVLSPDDMNQITALIDSIKADPSPHITYVRDIISRAVEFGGALLAEFAAENVKLGITQMNMTRTVTNHTRDIADAMTSGSLYLGIELIDELIADTNKHDAIFITMARLNDYKTKIADYLGG